MTASRRRKLMRLGKSLGLKTMNAQAGGRERMPGFYSPRHRVVQARTEERILKPTEVIEP